MAVDLPVSQAAPCPSPVERASGAIGGPPVALPSLHARPGLPATFDESLAACRNYLLLVADEELDVDLRAKIGASDLVQETLLDARRGHDQFCGGTHVQLRAWLRGILLNKITDAARHYNGTQKRRLTREVSLERDLGSRVRNNLADPAAETPSRLVCKDERAESLARAMARLSEEHRRVIRLRNWDQRSFAEIGQRMNRSAEAARKLWSRAIERLKDQWMAENGAR
jgi:RNA polymerase sigma-70 factor, ECF subfamily